MNFVLVLAAIVVAVAYGQNEGHLRRNTQFCAQVLACGSDGVTYPTPCDVPEGVDIECNRECPCTSEKETVKDPEVCAEIVSCGADGLTYPTPCALKDAGTKMQCENQCPCNYDGPACTKKLKLKRKPGMVTSSLNEFVLFQNITKPSGKLFVKSGKRCFKLCKKAPAFCLGYQYTAATKECLLFPFVPELVEMENITKEEEPSMESGILRFKPNGCNPFAKVK